MYENIRWVFEAKDYLRFRLTGEAFAEYTDSSGTSLLNLHTRQFDRELLRLYGIPEVWEALPPLRASADMCGRVTAEAAALTGIPAGTPVCGGMFDIDACAIAMDVSAEDRLCAVTGTWSINEYISRTPVPSDGTTLNSLFCLPEYYLIEESSPTSAGNLSWAVKHFMGRRSGRRCSVGSPCIRWPTGWWRPAIRPVAVPFFSPSFTAATRTAWNRQCWPG